MKSNNGFTPTPDLHGATGAGLTQPYANQVWGFSLVEVLLALSLLTVVALGALQLVTNSRQVAGRAREQFVAVNIAREGLELVRAVRDTNWFTNDDPTTWISDEMCQPFTYDIEALRQEAGVGSASNDVLYVRSNGEWGHDANGEATPYHRVLEVDCAEKDNDPPRVMVTARVSWESRGQDREVVLQERLYNWLP